MASDDLASLLVNQPEATVRFGQGEILEWSADTFENLILWRGSQLANVPVLSGVSALGYESGDIVALLGADTTGTKGVTQWWILGKIDLPGVDSPNVRIKGSSLSVYHPNGIPAIIIGILKNTDTGEDVGAGLVFQQDNEFDLFGIGKTDPTAKNVVRIQSHNNELVFTTDQTGRGLGRPFLDIPMYCMRSVTKVVSGSTVADTAWVLDTTSGVSQNAWVDVWEGRMYATHPTLRAQIFAWAISGNGEVRLQVNGVNFGTTQAVTAGNSGYYDLGTPLALPESLDYSGGFFYPITVQARITSASGRFFVRPYGVTKRESV